MVYPSCFCLWYFCFSGKYSNNWIWNDIGRNCFLGHRKKIAKFLIRTFTFLPLYLPLWSAGTRIISGRVYPCVQTLMKLSLPFQNDVLFMWLGDRRGRTFTLNKKKICRKLASNIRNFLTEAYIRKSFLINYTYNFAPDPFEIIFVFSCTKNIIWCGCNLSWP